MICISVTPTSRKLAKVDILNGSRQADVVEVCLDHLAKTPDMGEMLSGFETPLIVSCRRPQDGGQWKGGEDERFDLLRQAIIAEPEYVELELDIANRIPRFGKTKRIVSFTSLDRPLGNIDDIFDEAKRANADVVKVTWPTPDLDSAWPLLAAVSKKRDLPVVGMGIGASSVTYSLLGLKYGSPWVYAALESGMEAHEGQPTVWDLKDVYEASTIDANTKFVAVSGFGGTSMAAIRAFNAGYKKLGINSRCIPIDFRKLDMLGKRLDVLKIRALILPPDGGGRVASLATKMEKAVEQSGHVDLLLKQQDGWHGYNMIWRSTLKAVEKLLGTGDSEERPLDRRNVLLIGAGELAQAIAFGIGQRKGILSVTCPREDESDALAAKFGVRKVPFHNLYDTLADVVIIADPKLKMGHGKSELNASYLRETMTVVDVSRMPDDSEILAEARARGAKVVEPRDVFAEQLASEFKSISGQGLPADELTEAITAE